MRSSCYKETYTATDADQNAALVQNSGTLTMTDGTLSKSGDDTNGDSCNFYGLNSILLAVNDGSMAYISGSTLKADSEGSNAVLQPLEPPFMPTTIRLQPLRAIPVGSMPHTVVQL